MPIAAETLQQAIQLYLQNAYPGGVPAPIQSKIAPVMALSASQIVPVELLDKDPANSLPSYALRLGQPMYPFMKLVLDIAPGENPQSPSKFLLRADAHDRHLHAPEGSPDAAWLASVRVSNRDLVEKIESAWAQAGLPTFKEFLRQQLESRRAQKGAAGKP